MTEQDRMPPTSSLARFDEIEVSIDKLIAGGDGRGE